MMRMSMAHSVLHYGRLTGVFCTGQYLSCYNSVLLRATMIDGRGKA